MKKKFLISCLALAITFSGLGLVACGNENSSINPYNDYMETIATFKGSTTLFKESATIGGIETDFYLNNFNTMETSGQKVEGNKNFITLVGYGMNFIEKYYVYLSGRTGDDYSLLHETLNQLVSSYEVINQDSKNMVNADGIAHTQTYNNYFYEYEAHTKDFINDVYDTALTLSNFLINQAKFTNGLGTDQQTDVQIQFFMDNQILNVFDDLRQLLIVSACGVDYQSASYDGQPIELYNDSVNLLSYYATLSTHYIQSMTAETMAETIEISNLLASERENTEKALSNFSIYVFEDTYELSIDLYSLENQDALAYYTQLQKYFSLDNCFLTQYYNFLSQNVYE